MYLFIMCKSFLANTVRRVTAINKKYAEPSVEMSKAVKLSLLMLRVYLLVLVALLFYKFITLI